MASATTTCSGCGRSGPIELQMKLKSGQELTMISCTRCQERSWLADGEPVSREEVLKLTSGNPEFVQRPAAPRSRQGRARTGA